MPSLQFWKKYLSKEAYEYAEKKLNCRNTSTPTNMERTSCNKPLAKKTPPRFTGHVRISIVTVRKVLPRDHHAISEKYVLDSLVSANVLQDDSTHFIPEPPEVKVLAGMPEMTRIEIYAK